MPRVNITFAQLDLDIMDDDRWLFLCNERQQLLYIKIILLAGRLKNSVPINYAYLRTKCNYQGSDEELRGDIAHLLGIYPKLQNNDNCLFFKEFWKRYSYIPKKDRGKSQGNPKEIPSESSKGKSGFPTDAPIEGNLIEGNLIEGNINKSKIIKNNTSIKVVFNFDTHLFENITDKDLKEWQEAYPAIDITLEIKKAQQWLVSNPKNRKSNYRRFLTNWFNRGQDSAPRKDTNYGKTQTNTGTEPKDYKRKASEFRDYEEKCKREQKERESISITVDKKGN